jgi:hypothetical protein
MVVDLGGEHSQMRIPARETANMAVERRSQPEATRELGIEQTSLETSRR